MSTAADSGLGISHQFCRLIPTVAHPLAFSPGRWRLQRKRQRCPARREPRPPNNTTGETAAGGAPALQFGGRPALNKRGYSRTARRSLALQKIRLRQGFGGHATTRTPGQVTPAHNSETTGGRGQRPRLQIGDGGGRGQRRLKPAATVLRRRGDPLLARAATVRRRRRTNLVA